MWNFIDRKSNTTDLLEPQCAGCNAIKPQQQVLKRPCMALIYPHRWFCLFIKCEQDKTVLILLELLKQFRWENLHLFHFYCSMKFSCIMSVSKKAPLKFSLSRNSLNKCNMWYSSLPIFVYLSAFSAGFLVFLTIHLSTWNHLTDTCRWRYGFSSSYLLLLSSKSISEWAGASSSW